MDELEFRRRLLSDPNSKDPMFKQQLLQDPAKQQLQHDVLRLDQQLKSALNVPLPTDLAERLLLQQSLAAFHERKQKRWRYTLALAASFACFGVLTSHPFWMTQSQDMATHALAHVYHEVSALEDRVSEIPLAEVNRLLADFDAELQDWNGQIRYARFCDFDGIRSLHLIFETTEGPMTLFVLPKDHQFIAKTEFHDPKFFGQSVQLSHADLIIVSSFQQPIQFFRQNLLRHLKFSSV